MPKTLEQLTQSEKIEDLRRDVQRLFAAINSAKNDINVVSGFSGEIGDLVKKLEREVKALKGGAKR